MQFLQEKLGPNSRNLSSLKIRQGEEGKTYLSPTKLKEFFLSFILPKMNYKYNF